MRRARLLPAAALLLAAAAPTAAAPAGAAAPPLTLVLAVAAADSGAGGLGGLVKQVQDAAAADSLRALSDSLAVVGAAGAPAAPWVVNWSRTPSAKMRADARTVRWGGALETVLALRDRSKVIAGGSWSSEDYRQQDKTVEERSGSLKYDDAQDRRLALVLDMRNDWSEDRTVNLTGLSNVNKRDFRQARVTVDSLGLRTGGVRHDWTFGGKLDRQAGSSLGIVNDYRESTVNGHYTGRYRPAEGVAVVATLWGEKTGGTRTLGNESQSSSASGDTLGAWMGWERGRVRGAFSVKQSNFDKKYLDYRRNANGVVDTLGVAEKIVQELEQNDATALDWRGGVDLGAIALDTELGRDVRRNSFRASGAGRKEDEQSRANLTAKWYARADSVQVSYRYTWRWDDQIYKGATAARGRQYSKRRELGFDWTHRLFARTRVRANWQYNLQQEIAQNQFNENDRDRLESNFSTRLESNWSRRFRTTMVFAYRHVEEVSIRRTRSANNNVKDTYEIAPGYLWPVASWLSFQQDYRLSIQYTDYLFSGFEGVTARDDYNKRGNLNTKVNLRPNQRLTLLVGHDWNLRRNATKSSTDAAGRSLYTKDLLQRISTLSFALTYKLSEAVTLEGATKYTEDSKDTFGARASSQVRPGGEVAVGGVVKKTWQGRAGTRELSGRVKRNFAHGPNVQAANADYWDADVSFLWRF